MSTSSQKSISFSLPNLTEKEIAAISESCSNHKENSEILTEKVVKLEQDFCNFTQADASVHFPSAITALEACLKILGIGPGDEVIISAYSNPADIMSIDYIGATPVLCDTMPGSFEMDYSSLPDLITKQTKAVIAFDFAGRMCDYDRLQNMLLMKKDLWNPSSSFQEAFERIPIIADGFASLGASYHGKTSGSAADFTILAFNISQDLHPLGGAMLAWKCPKEKPALPSIFEQASSEPKIKPFDSDKFYKQASFLSDEAIHEYALTLEDKSSPLTTTVVQIALAQNQLDRYRETLEKRKELILYYEKLLSDLPVSVFMHYGNWAESSGGLLAIRINNVSRKYRNRVIEHMQQKNIATEIHYRPLPCYFTYQKRGFKKEDYPNSLAMYANELTLPLHAQLTKADIDTIVEALTESLQQANDEHIVEEETSKQASEKRLQAYIDRMDAENGWKAPVAFKGYQDEELEI